MASKVEELRDKLRLDGRGMPYSYFNEVLDSLIASAEARGVAKARAEGTELMKEDIRKASMHYGDGEEIEGSDAETAEGDGAIAQYEMYVVPASVLAPKEKP